MASEDGSGEEDKKVVDMQVDNPEIEAETNPNRNDEDSVMEDKEEEEKENDSEKAKESIENEEEKESDKAEEEEEKEDEEEKVSKKGSEVKTPVSKNQMREATIERPSRERKTVERYTETSVARGSGTKPFSIQKGKGTMFKDIPNVAFKLSKIKPDDNLQLLHYILFGKRTKVHTLKKNIGLFSGFVWAENEEKQRTKIKERIDKCVKEKLQFVCDILNIPFNKTSTKKEDLSAKLLEFLESPHVTTEELLADKEVKGKRLKRKGKSSKSPSSVDEASGASSKKQKLNSESEKKRKRPSKNAEEADDEGEHSESKDASQDDDNDSNSDTVSKEESEQESKSEEEEENEKVNPKTQSTNKRSSTKAASKSDSGGKTVDKSKSVKKTTPTKSSKATPKSTKKSSMSSAKKKAEKTDTIAASGSSRKSKVPSSKKQKFEKEHEDQMLSAKEKTTSKRKSSIKALAKDQGNGTRSKKAKPEPSKEEMHAVVADILKKVDFNTATLSDILKQLGAHFDIDLMHRKVEVKSIITDVINNMTDEDDDGEEDSGEEVKGDGEDDNNA